MGNLYVSGPLWHWLKHIFPRDLYLTLFSAETFESRAKAKGKLNKIILIASTFLVFIHIRSSRRKPVENHFQGLNPFHFPFLFHFTFTFSILSDLKIEFSSCVELLSDFFPWKCCNRVVEMWKEEEKFALMKYDRLEFNHMTCFYFFSLSFVSSPFIFIAKKNNKLFHFTRKKWISICVLRMPILIFSLPFCPLFFAFPSSLHSRATPSDSIQFHSKFLILPMPKIGVTDDFSL